MNACWLFTAALAQQGPTPDLADEAEHHFERAIDFARRGQLEDALERLLLSNRLAPNRNVAFNIARIYERMEQFDRAYRYYGEFLTHEPDPSRRSEAELRLESLAKKVALVEIVSDPVGATVYMDRRDLGARGVTPLTLALPAGEHTVILEHPDHHAAEQDVSMAVGTRERVERRLDPILGTVSVQGDPLGATVHGSDGELLGVIPGEFMLTPGTHTLQVSAPAHRTRSYVLRVEPEQETVLISELEPQLGVAVISATEPGARIEIDGIPVGFTPSLLELPVGEHRITIRMRGYAPFTQDVEIEDASSVELDAVLLPAREVTAASRSTEDRFEAAASVSIIDRSEIEAFGYQTVYEALGGTRGVFQTDDLTYRYLGIRGFSRPGDYGNRVLVTVDGHTYNDDQIGASYVGEDLSVDLGDVEQIEVVRGPGSALYGTNAFLGVINVVTRDSVPAQATVAADGKRTLRASSRTSLGDEERGLLLSAGGLVSQGADYVFPEYAVDGEEGLSTGADSSRAVSAQVKAWGGDFTAQIWGSSRQKHVPTGAFGTILADPRTLSQDTRAFADLRYEPTLSKRVRLLGRAYLDAYHYRGDWAYETDWLSFDRWTGVWVGVDPRLVTTLAPWLSATVGAEARAYLVADLDGYDSDGVFLESRAPQQVLSGYAVVDAEPSRAVKLQLGARYDHFTLAGIGGAFSPRAAAMFRPNEKSHLKFLFGTAFRAPSPYELLYDDGGLTQVAPDQLEPERIATLELEAGHRFDELTSLVVSVNGNQISELIDTVNTGVQGEEDELIVFANTEGFVRSAGLELELRREWRRGFMIATQHTLQRARQGRLLGGAPLSNSPAYEGSIKAAVPIVPRLVAASTRLRAGSPRTTLYDTRTEWSALWDLTLTGAPADAPIRYAVGVRNVLDWQFTQPGGFDLVQTGIPQPGRSFFASLTLLAPRRATDNAGPQ